jgi:anti-anti-sigma factor
VSELSRGDHACLVCASDEERWSIVSEYVRRGIEAGERTLYVTAEHSVLEVVRALDIGDAVGGELVVLPAAVAPGYAEGDFDYIARLGEWEAQARAAVAEGFTGLRVAVDMTWLDEVELSLSALVDYEHRGSALVAGLPGTALCIYDLRRFHPHTLARASHAHPIRLGEAVAGAPVFESAILTISTAGPGALVLRGEVDASNAAALADALAGAANGDNALVIDMRLLAFIDVAGLRAIHRAWRRLGRRGEMVLLSPPSIVSRMMPVLGIAGELTLDEGAR